MSERYTPEQMRKYEETAELFRASIPIGGPAGVKGYDANTEAALAALRKDLAAAQEEIARLTAERPHAESDFAQVRSTAIPHQRLYDLLRQMRHHLLDEALINLGEFSWLMAGAPNVTGGGSPAPRRLETYDEHEARMVAAESAMLRQAATDKVSVVDPMPVLRQFVKTFPSQRHAAAKLGISQQYLTDILHGRRDFSDRILQAVGLQRVIIVTEAKP